MIVEYKEAIGVLPSGFYVIGTVVDMDEHRITLEDGVELYSFAPIEVEPYTQERARELLRKSAVETEEQKKDWKKTRWGSGDDPETWEYVSTLRRVYVAGKDRLVKRPGKKKWVESKVIIPYSRVIGRDEERTVIGIAVDVYNDLVDIEEDETNEIYAFRAAEVAPYEVEATSEKKPKGKKKRK